MKTTVDIDDDLLKAAKKRAIDEGTTLRALLERGLRRELTGSASAADRAQHVRDLFERNRRRLEAGREAPMAAGGKKKEHPSWRAELYEEHLDQKKRDDDEARARWLSHQGQA